MLKIHIHGSLKALVPIQVCSGLDWESFGCQVETEDPSLSPLCVYVQAEDELETFSGSVHK